MFNKDTRAVLMNLLLLVELGDVILTFIQYGFKNSHLMCTVPFTSFRFHIIKKSIEKNTRGEKNQSEVVLNEQFYIIIASLSFFV